MTHEIALRVIQEAISALASFADVKLPGNCKLLEENDTVKEAIAKAKKILLSSEKTWQGEDIGELQLLFNRVQLEKNKREFTHYVPLEAIADSDPKIPYPVEKEPDLEEYKNLVKAEWVEEGIDKLTPDDWKNLSLLTLIVEKYGWCLSFGYPDVALIDIAKSTAALACAIAHNPETENICLVAGDLSGIQKFIYTISSDGALKSLRARSFYLELVAEEIVQQLLEKLKLPRTSVIYSGGGNLYILAPANEKKTTEKAVEEVQSSFNKWLKDEFQEKVFLALDCHSFPAADVAGKTIGDHWSEAISKLNKQKSRKFIDQIADLLETKISYEQRCRVCHRDDKDKNDLKPLDGKDDAVLACETCRNMFELGGRLFGVEAIVRSSEKEIPGLKNPIAFELDTVRVYYHICKNWQTIVKGADTALLVNDWTIKNYKFRPSQEPMPLLLGNYAKKTESEEEKPHTMRAEELAEEARGVKRVGYLRMDVDRLGQIFAKGLGEKHSLTRLAGLSRQMSYFFKVYLNSLAEKRMENLPEQLKDSKTLSGGKRDRLVFIYAGGDDVFVSGSWNEVVDFGFDIYQAFREYTGHNPDITLSAGISIAGSKFPLYQAAEESGDAEKEAKGNGRDSLGLFGEVFKWNEWLGGQNGSNLIWGILSLVAQLEELKLETNVARSFVRNLLITAQKQDRMIEERRRKIEDLEKKSNNKSQNETTISRLKEEQKDIKNYLHLPQIAYTISRLPKQIQNNLAFRPIRQALLSTKNAPYFRAVATWIELLNRKTD